MYLAASDIVRREVRLHRRARLADVLAGSARGRMVYTLERFYVKPTVDFMTYGCSKFDYEELSRRFIHWYERLNRLAKKRAGDRQP